jgi:hypothetical protein
MMIPLGRISDGQLPSQILVGDIVPEHARHFVILFIRSRATRNQVEVYAF